MGQALESSLLRNPFYILGVSPRDTEDQLHTAVEMAVDGGVDEHVAHSALQELLVPRKRLAAELRWFPGVETSTVRHALGAIKSGDFAAALRVARALEGMAAVNLAAALLYSAPATEDAISVLLEGHRELVPSRLQETVNADRSLAGIGRATLEAVRDELSRAVDEQIASTAARLLATEAPERLLTRLVQDHIQDKDGALVFVERLCERVEPAFQTRLGALDTEIGAALSLLKKRPSDDIALSRFLRALEEWDRLLQPQQLLHQSRASDEPRSSAMLRRVRSVAVDLANEMNAHDTALRLTEALREHFPELPGSQELIEGDREVLQELLEEETLTEPLEVLRKLVEQLTENPKPLVAATTEGPLGLTSKGIALTLYRAFQRAEQATRGSKYEEVPWGMVRSLAIDLHNDATEPWAAWSLVQGLLNHGSVPAKIASSLRVDERACRKTISYFWFKSALEQKNLSEIVKRAKALLELEEDPEARASIQAVVSRMRSERNQKVAGFGCLALLAAGLALGAVQDSCRGSSKAKPARSAASTSTARPAPAPKREVRPTFVEPALPLPSTRILADRRRGDEEAPLRVVTSPQGGHCYLKLVRERDGATLVTAFVRAGDSIEIAMPLDSFRLRHASGTTWYGTQHLFGPETAYAEADEILRFWSDGYQVHGFTIELIARVGGNLKERRLSAEQF